MRLFDGKKVSEKILAELKKKIKKENLKPKLAVILIGEDEASKIYIRLKKEATEKIGAEFELFKYSKNEKEENIVAKINELNNSASVSGIITQLPLPARFNKDKILTAIDPLKDVDGFHEENKRLFEEGKPRFMPVLPSAILFTIKDALNGEIVAKKAVALVNSDIFGNMLNLVLGKDGIDFKYKLQKVCLISGKENDLKEADIVITACGCPNLIRGEMIKQGAVLIDAGIFRTADGKITGDINRKSVENKANFLTPVPGGIGPLVIALLLKNVVRAIKIDRENIIR